MPRIKRNTDANHVIGLVVNTFIKPHRDVMLGWMRHGRNRDDIELRFFLASTATTIENLLAFARSGIDALVLCGLQEATVVDFLKSSHLNMPIVICAQMLSCNIDLNILPNVGMVFVDSAAIGRHVGEFFLEHGLDNFAFMGITIDKKKNDCRGKEVEITGKDSKVRVFIIPTNEELMIAKDTQELVEAM